jgi:hypothetical protein
LISHRYRCIFVHQRKCASTSITAAFGAEPGSQEFRVFANGLFRPGDEPYFPYRESYFKFAVVRNPWDRFVSGWKYCISTRDRPLIDVLKNPPASKHDRIHVMRPQFVTLIRKGASSRLAVDELIRYEALDEGFRKVCARIGMPPVELPRLNVTTHPPYQEVFDEESRELFAQIFSEDIRRFGYEFDGSFRDP